MKSFRENFVFEERRTMQFVVDRTCDAMQAAARAMTGKSFGKFEGEPFVVSVLLGEGTSRYCGGRAFMVTEEDAKRYVTDDTRRRIVCEHMGHLIE